MSHEAARVPHHSWQCGADISCDRGRRRCLSKPASVPSLRPTRRRPLKAFPNTEGFTIPKVNMTISLGFLAPKIVEPAIGGRLPHGMGVIRLTHLPAEWSRPRELLG